MRRNSNSARPRPPRNAAGLSVGANNAYVRPKKHLGQHFLTDSGIAARIAGGMTGFGSYYYLIEVGAGTGILTKHLMGLPYRLWLSEVDEQSIAYLIRELRVDSSCILGDFLRLDVANLFRGDSSLVGSSVDSPGAGGVSGDVGDSNACARDQRGAGSLEAGGVSGDVGVLNTDVVGKNDLGAGGRISLQPQIGVVGNFPYHISSQILFRVLEQKRYIPEMCGMFQREVAQRICASPGNKTYGILSVLTQAYYHTEYLFTVNEGVFNPPPKVKSGVIRLQRLPQPADCDEGLLRRLVKAGFNQRRKRLGNALKTVLPVGYPDALCLMDLRAEQLSVDMFVALTRDVALHMTESPEIA